MAGDLRLLSEDGNATRSMAMGLTSAARGIDHIGGNVFYAVDTQRLYKLTITNGVVSTVGTPVNIVDQIISDIVTSASLSAICSNPSGHWIAVFSNETGDITGFVLSVYRVSIDGQVDRRIPQLAVNANITEGEPGIIDITQDNEAVFLLYQFTQDTMNASTVRKFYYRDGRNIRQVSTGNNNLRFTSFAWNVKDFYVIKRAGNDLATYSYPFFTQINRLSNPTLAAQAICTFKNNGAQSGLDLMVDNETGTEDNLGFGTIKAVHVR